MNCKSTKTPTRPMHLLKFKSFKSFAKTNNCHASFSCFPQWRRNPTKMYVRRAKKMIEYNSTYEDEVVVEIRRQKTKNEPFVDKTKNNRKQCRLQ